MEHVLKGPRHLNSRVQAMELQSAESGVTVDGLSLGSSDRAAPRVTIIANYCHVVLLYTSITASEHSSLDELGSDVSY